MLGDGMSESLTGVDGDDLVRRVLEAANDELRLFQVAPSVLARFIDVANREDVSDVAIKVLADSRVMKRVTDDFLVASAASALVERDSLTIRTTSSDAERSLVLIDDDSVVSFVSLDASIGALQSDEPELCSTASEAFEDRWATAEPHDVRTPPISRVMSSLRREIGDAAASDFAAMLEVLETASGDDGLDEVAVALLAAARNEVLLYDISKWGEDSGVASKATFSRKKTEMEDSGLIDTENVPIDIGRPRLRLGFVDDELHEAPIDDVVAAARDALH